MRSEGFQLGKARDVRAGEPVPVSLCRQAVHLVVVKNNLMKASCFQAVPIIPPQLGSPTDTACHVPNCNIQHVCVSPQETVIPWGGIVFLTLLWLQGILVE